MDDLDNAVIVWWAEAIHTKYLETLDSGDTGS